MKLDIATQWAKALRSGEYKKGKKYLRMKDKYCCLGVLCDLYNKEHPKNQVDLDGEEQSGGKLYGGALPHQVTYWAKMASNNGYFGCTDLVELNDSRTQKRGFQYIADTIEHHAKDL